MPIFQDPNQRCNQDTGQTWPGRRVRRSQQWGNMRCPKTEEERREEEESKTGDSEMEDVSPAEDLLARLLATRMETSDRVELIERIKRGESPTWVPGRALEDYFTNHDDPPQSRLPKTTKKEGSSPLLPSAQLKESLKPSSIEQEPLGSPSEIQRPRSALHSGDFREGTSQQGEQKQNGFHSPPMSQSFQGPLGSSPTTPWYTPASVHSFSRLQNQFQADLRFPPSKEERPTRSRAPSLGSFSSSFALKPPTSPLVHQSNNTDLDFSPRVDLMDLSSSPDKASRRRTLPPDTFRSMQSSLQNFSSPPRPPGLRREGSYQAHQPRRSVTSSYNTQHVFPPQTPGLRSRAPSFSSDVSPLQHASMVGSYEESILRGRMSTTPSKPLNFMAQIGVLGKGPCRPSLKCPPHITVPFPAVFYCYPNTGNRRSSFSEDGPSPYVGLIDLDNIARAEGSARSGGPSNDHASHEELQSRLRTRIEKKVDASKLPPGGSYRIPQKGQLQIIIKNPNKTAVKLYLVPYDLEGMEPGTKTFIRQRSYSAGPIIDFPLSTRMNIGTEKPERSPNESDAFKEKPVLRYLIHLHICSPSKGRFYLYQGVRVVFANRVPDDKEKLRNEIQLPEPRYSPYTPKRDPAMGAAGAKLAQEKAFRRRSSGFGIGPGGYDAMDGIVSEGVSTISQPPPVPPMPMSPPSRRHTPPSSRIQMSFGTSRMSSSPPSMNEQSFVPSRSMALPTALSPSDISSPYLSPSSTGSDGYNKLSKGDAGYGGNAFGFTNSGGEAGEGLLAKKLKGLDVKKVEKWRDETQL